LPVIDVHAHVTPPSFREAVLDGGTWHTLTNAIGELEIPEFSISPEDRIAKMDAAGVDMHVLTVNNDFYRYELDPAVTQEIARACNEEIGEMMRAHPGRFTGLATVPMQDVGLAVAEMEFAMSKLGYRGITINDHVNGVTFDDPRFYPFWEAVESLGAVVFFHQCGPTLVKARTSRYALPNSVGNLVDRAVTFGTLVFGGIMDRYPGLKICLAHAGGYSAFGAARMDKTWRAAEMEVPEFADAKANITRPPSEYLSRFYYDSCTYTEATLRFVIDAVGIDRVVLGTDYPAPMVQDDPVGWLEKMPGITEAERTAILSTNPARMLSL
jgi:aminocarboxymuconate-semialdehyde decarboxylase